MSRGIFEKKLVKPVHLGLVAWAGFVSFVDLVMVVLSLSIKDRRFAQLDCWLICTSFINE